MSYSGLRLIALSVVFSTLLCCQGAGGGGGDSGGGDSPGPGSQSLSGVLYDACSGAPISGAQVRFGGEAIETGAGGAFEFALDDATPTLSEPFSVVADGHAFLFVAQLDVDTVDGGSLAVPLPRTDPATYSGRKTINGRVYDDGDEISAALVTVRVYGTNGTSESFDPQAYAGGYSVETAVRSSDSLVMVQVADVSVDGTPRGGFSYFDSGVDLSAAGSTTVDVSRPAAGHYDFASLTNGNAGDVAMCYYVTGYGAIPCSWAPATPDGELIPGEDSTNEITFDPASPHVALYNPEGWQRLVLIRSRTDFSGPSGKRFASAGEETALGSNLALPNLDLTLGPTGFLYDDSLSLTGNTLSLSPAAGADLYLHSLAVDTGLLGLVIAREASVVLPVSVLGVMAGRSVTDFFRVMDIEPSVLRPGVLYPAGVLEAPTFPPSLRLGEIAPEGGPFSDELDVPEGGTIEIGLE